MGMVAWKGEVDAVLCVSWVSQNIGFDGERDVEGNMVCTCTYTWEQGYMYLSVTGVNRLGFFGLRRLPHGMMV